MNRRLALAVPSAALIVGVGAIALPASAQTVPAPYTTNTPEAPDEGVLDNGITDDSDDTDEDTDAATPSSTTGGSTGATSTSSSTNAGSLPFTGTESGLVLGLAAGALAAGAVLVGVGRRRTTT